MVRLAITLRYSLVGAVLFSISAGPACAQAAPPHPMNKPGLVLEYDRAIYTIQRGVALNWSDPRLFLDAFDRMSRTGTAGESLTEEYRVVRHLLTARFSSFMKASTTPWDEKPPAPVRQLPRLESVLQDLSFAREALIAADAADTEPKPPSASSSGR
jgi:hypothetical protein